MSRNERKKKLGLACWGPVILAVIVTERPFSDSLARRRLCKKHHIAPAALLLLGLLQKKKKKSQLTNNSHPLSGLLPSWKLLSLPWPSGRVDWKGALGRIISNRGTGFIRIARLEIGANRAGQIEA